MSGMDAALKAVAAKSLDEAIVNTCIGMGIGVTLALVMIKSGRPFIRGFTAGVGTGVGAGIAYVHADERYLRYQSEQLNTLPAEKR